MILVIILILLIFGFGSGYVLYPHYGIAGGLGPFGLLLLILAILWFTGLMPRGR